MPDPTPRPKFDAWRAQWVDTLQPWSLAAVAEVGDPDGAKSPGARWLRSTARSIADMIPDYDPQVLDQDTDSVRDTIHRLLDKLDDSGALHETIDGCVPIYTDELWQVFTDLRGWQDPDLDEFLGILEHMNLERLPQTFAYVAAQRLAAAMLDDLRQRSEWVNA
jgi:hypothetical protein